MLVVEMSATTEKVAAAESALSSKVKPYLVLPPGFADKKKISDLLANWGVLTVDGTRQFNAITKGAYDDAVSKTKRQQYNSRPEVRARKREYFNREDVKQKRKEYSQRADVKERKKEVAARRSKILKELRETHPEMYAEIANKLSE